ncbi:site-specific integrase [Listeria grayi]|uniref:site-specific integrase n=1 Tax=Listeria grayi TaxID=1641 RepID=UPI00162535E3|nr:site-specific integrase [Listeria grayi]MBC1921947.1 tyrosine-type recombinase/integrase [Listeria grayi]
MANKKRYFGSIEKLKTGWRLRVTVGYNENGRPIRRSKTTKTKNAKEREKELNRFIDELEKNGYEAPSKLTFKEFVENEWLPKHAQRYLAYKTYNEYHSQIKRRLYPIIGGVQLDKISTIQIVNLIDTLQKSDSNLVTGEILSARTIRNIYFALSSVLETAVEWKVLATNPAKGVKLPKIKKRPPTIYTPEDIAQLDKALAKEPIQMQAMIYIALITGCREAELAALEWKHIDFVENEITFEQTAIMVVGEGVRIKPGTKNGETGKVDIPTWLSALLESYKPLSLPGTGEWTGHHFLFADPTGKPFRPDSYYQRWKRLTERHGLPSIRFHDLRHTSATLLLNNGLDIKVIQERLRHKSFNTTADIYSHVLKEKQQEAANTFKNPFS